MFNQHKVKVLETMGIYYLSPKNFLIDESQYAVYNPTVMPEVLILIKENIFKIPKYNKLLLKMLKVLETEHWTIIGYNDSILKCDPNKHVSIILKAWKPKQVVLMGQELVSWILKKKLSTVRSKKLQLQIGTNIYATECPEILYNNPVEKKKSYQDLCILKANL